MASNRHLGRIIVLQSLYEVAFRKSCDDKSVDDEEVISRNISRYRAKVDDRGFILRLAKGIEKNSAKLDEKLQPIAPEWPLDQIARIDHIILRMGAYELIHNKDVPSKVVINEAVELAKSFGGKNSSKFINGVLGTLLKDINPKLTQELEEAEAKKHKKEKK